MTLIAWVVAGGLALIFVLVNGANIALLLRDRGGGSPILFVGGIAGALAMWLVPVDGAREYFWLPLVLDLGTGGYLLIIALAMFFSGFGSAGWLRQVPFVRYLLKPAAAPPAPRLPAHSAAVAGCILGTAVGDAMGLAFEGLSRDRQRRMHPLLCGYRFFFGKGFSSDDTEHTCMLAQTLIEIRGHADDLAGQALYANFAWRLRFWLLLLPAGVGAATARAIIKLWLFFPGRYAGVRSAGNGPAMRSALIGVCYGDNPVRFKSLLSACTRITHTHPDAEDGARAIALAAHLAAGDEQPITPAAYLQICREHMPTNAPLLGLIGDVVDSVERGDTAEVLADAIGCRAGVSGYIRHTVPMVLHVWLTHQNDYQGGVTRMIQLGGDSDTTAAIVGAIIGARVGKVGIPEPWLKNLWEWPRSVTWMEKLGRTLAGACEEPTAATQENVPFVNPLFLLLRNVVFLAVVLLHGFRRLLPPY